MKIQINPHPVLAGISQSTASPVRRIASALTVLALMLAVNVGATPKALAAGPVILPNRTLVNSYFETNNVPVRATCAAATCVSLPVPLFAPLPVTCPGVIGATCTFYVHLETDDTLTTGDEGEYQFLPVPLPGPTLPGGFVIWDADTQAFGAAPDQAFTHSYAVVAEVTNTVANQVYPILVNLRCTDINAPAGCTAVTGLSNLEVNVYKP